MADQTFRFALWGSGDSVVDYGIKPRDPVTMEGAAVLRAFVVLIASYGPAWRASRLQPMDALRDE